MMLQTPPSLETWSLTKQPDLILPILTRQPRQLPCLLLDLVNNILEDPIQGSEVSFLRDPRQLQEHPVHVLPPPTPDMNHCQTTIDE